MKTGRPDLPWMEDLTRESILPGLGSAKLEGRESAKRIADRASPQTQHARTSCAKSHDFRIGKAVNGKLEDFRSVIRRIEYRGQARTRCRGRHPVRHRLLSGCRYEFCAPIVSTSVVMRSSAGLGDAQVGTHWRLAPSPHVITPCSDRTAQPGHPGYRAQCADDL